MLVVEAMTRWALAGSTEMPEKALVTPLGVTLVQLPLETLYFHTWPAFMGSAGLTLLPPVPFSLGPAPLP
jgi:hypothetical protein